MPVSGSLAITSVKPTITHINFGFFIMIQYTFFNKFNIQFLIKKIYIF